jgi:hypothetical protein
VLVIVTVGSPSTSPTVPAGDKRGGGRDHPLASTRGEHVIAQQEQALAQSSSWSRSHG